MRFINILAILLLVSLPAWAGSQARAPLTSGMTTELSATNLGTTPVTVLVADTFRGYLRIQNIGAANTLTCTTDGSAPVNASHGISLAPGASEKFDTFVPLAAVICVGSAASTAYNITYVRGF